MRIILDLDLPCSQATLARVTGRSEGRVSQWVADGTLQPGATALEWLHAVMERLSAEAAGRYSDGPLDLTQERAALAREQRMGIEIKNAVLRGEYAPIELLGRVLASASQAIAERFDHLPGRVKKACPNLPAGALDEVLSVIATARNEWVLETVALVSAQIVAGDDDDDDVDEPTVQGDAAA